MDDILPPLIMARSVRGFSDCRRPGLREWEFDWRFADDDDSFQGHFPTYPILPGAFLLEMAQHAANHALAQSGQTGRRVTSVTRLRFQNPVLPGDTCTLQVAWDDLDAVQIRFTKPGGAVAHGILGTGPVPRHAGASEVSAAELPRDPTVALKVLPHGHPMRLVDRVALDGTARAVAYKNITLNEPCFSAAHRGMDEAQLAYPLALLVESFAQGAGLLLSRRGFFADAGGAASLTVFGEFRGIHLLGRALPGDQLRHDVHLLECGRNVAHLAGQTSVGGRTVALFDDLMAFSIGATTLGAAGGQR
ncbi:3-hydroxyacyl-[acyl-carrier-protein] dehydratase FabZ [compost metagenome]